MKILIKPFQDITEWSVTKQPVHKAYHKMLFACVTLVCLEDNIAFLE